jgi:hypothetical protein
MIPLLGVLAIAALTLTGQTPLNLALNGQDFKIASRDGSTVVAAEGATAYADVVTMKDGRVDPALKAKLGAAEISDGVCLSLVLTFPYLGSYTVQLQTTGKTRLSDVTAHVDVVSATGAELNPATKDGKPAAEDMHNVTQPIRANKDASELEFAGHRGTLGLELPGAVRAGSLQIGGKSATIRGILAISGLKFPWISHGRGIAHGECF